MAPLISVIVPTYNRTDLLLSRCLPSVFGQTVQDFEALVIGDGTEQATVDAMADFPDDRLWFWNLPHAEYPEDFDDRRAVIGLPSLNFGLDRARGEWVAVLADDDEWTPDHHAVLLSAAERNGAQHVYGISETWKDGRRTDQFYGAWPPGGGQFCNGANLYRADLDYRYAMDCRSRGRMGDEDLWLRMVEGGVRFHFEREVVHKYHRNYP